jgi:predicted ATPase
MKRIVLTGGPGAGKSRISDALAAADPSGIYHVHEAATQVYQSLGSRWDRMDVTNRKSAQRQIYRLQVDQEARAAAAARPDQILLLDRGTIDGAAYWPDGPDAYWLDLGTTLPRELARYDAVIWLQTSAVLGEYDGDQSNPVRFEAPEAAIASGQLLRKLWGGHPNLKMVDAFKEFDEKIAAVSAVLKSLA